MLDSRTAGGIGLQPVRDGGARPTPQPSKLKPTNLIDLFVLIDLNDLNDLNDLTTRPRQGTKKGRGLGLSLRPGEGGGYLLFRFRSTIGVAGFNFSVRNGKRWSPRAIAT